MVLGSATNDNEEEIQMDITNMKAPLNGAQLRAALVDLATYGKVYVHSEEAANYVKDNAPANIRNISVKQSCGSSVWVVEEVS